MAEHETVAALASQLASIRGEIGEIRTSIAAFAARLDQETGPVMVLQTSHKRIREQLDRLQAHVEELTAEISDEDDRDDGEEDAGHPAIARWDHGDPADLAAQFAELEHWVSNVLRIQYPGYLRYLPGCWRNHREAVWELSTLHAEWQRITGPDDISLADAQWWHERWLPGVLQRLRAAIHCDAAQCALTPRPAAIRDDDPVGISFARHRT